MFTSRSCDNSILKIEAQSLYPFTLLVSVFSLLAAFVANRSESVGTDTASYIRFFNDVVHDGAEGRFEPGFTLIAYLVSLATSDHRTFFYVASWTLFVSSGLALYVLLNRVLASDLRKEYVLYIAIAVLLASPFYFSMHVNILRHGLAVPMLLFGYIFIVDRNYVLSAIFFLLATSFHSSSMIHILLAPLLLANLRVILIGVVVLSLLYLSNLSQALLSPVMGLLGMGATLAEISQYGESSEYRAGVRSDFWIFTAFFVTVATALWYRNVVSEALPKILCISFFPFLLFGFIAYSDRLLVFSWFLIPAVIAASMAMGLGRLYRETSFIISNFLFIAVSAYFIHKLGYIG